MSGEQQLSSGEKLRELSEHRETWCAVERMKEEAWCRKKRKHFKHHLESNLFEETATDPMNEPRCTFEVNAPTHLERRHFPAKHCEFVLFFLALDHILGGIW